MGLKCGSAGALRGRILVLLEPLGAGMELRWLRPRVCSPKCPLYDVVCSEEGLVFLKMRCHRSRAQGYWGEGGAWLPAWPPVLLLTPLCMPGGSGVWIQKSSMERARLKPQRIHRLAKKRTKGPSRPDCQRRLSQAV